MTMFLLRWWRRTLRITGYGGPAALLLLVLVVALAATMPRINRALHRADADVGARAAMLQSGGPSLRPPTRDEQLREYVSAFPQPQQMPDDLAEIYASAERHHVALVRGDYQLKSERESPFISYVATFPVHSEYGSVKTFAADVLENLPHASLDELKLSRDGAGTGSLDAVIRFTLTYRSM
jgi:hypothetical protein